MQLSLSIVNHLEFDGVVIPRSSIVYSTRSSFLALKSNLTYYNYLSNYLFLAVKFSCPRKISYFLLILIILLLQNSTRAANDSTTTCTVTPPTLSFGSYIPYNGNIEYTNGTITVKCTNNFIFSQSFTYTLTVSSTAGAGTSTSRVLKNGTNSVSYNIYTDSACTQIFGDGTNGTSYFSQAVSLPFIFSSATYYHTVYAKIPVQPLSKMMTYSDTANLLLSY